MDPIRWTEKSLEFQTLVESPDIKKPLLTLYDDRSAIVGVKICGEFITASPCKITKNQFIPQQKEIVLLSKYEAIWKVISKGTSKNESYIRRLSTKDIEEIHFNDFQNERITPRTFFCTKEVEAFDLLIHENDPTVVDGQRIDRRKKRIEESMEFEIVDVGEVEYTPTEGERTSQDYVQPPKNKSLKFLPFRMSNNSYVEQLVRNRVIRALSCKTNSDSQRRHFLLEVNEDPCDIRPMASEGSIELRYVHSTQNLYNYMSNYGNDIFLRVKLVRGEIPTKAIDSDGYMVFTGSFVGERVPMCYTDNYALSLVSPDAHVRVKLPIDQYKWRSIPEAHAAERQCMQLSLALLSRYESESYVIFDKTLNNYNIRSNDNQKSQLLPPRKRSDTIEKHTDKTEKGFHSPILPLAASNNIHRVPLRATKTISDSDGNISSQQKLRIPKAAPASHVPSDQLYRDNEKRLTQDDNRPERRHQKPEERSHHSQPKSVHSTSTLHLPVSISAVTFKNKNRH